MKKLGVALIVLGLVAVLVAFCPGIAGEENPAEGFGPQQMTALIVGIVLVVIGLVMCKCGSCACSCDTGADAEPDNENDETVDAQEPAAPEEQSSE